MRQILIIMMSIVFAQKVSINNATLDQVKALPLTEDQALSVYEYILFQGPIENIYELGKIENIEPENIQALKPLVSISMKYDTTTAPVSRLSDRYRKVENWTSEEGANEGLVEVWLDRLAESKKEWLKYSCPKRDSEPATRDKFFCFAMPAGFTNADHDV